MGLERLTVEANGVEFVCFAAGSGPLALCLHGFPDSANTWRYLIPELANAGFRAVAPFMRGYAPTSIPPDGLYQTGALAADANALHEALGGRSDAVIIGHDWGAPATYGAAVTEPDRWQRVVGMAVPPMGAAGEAIIGYYPQTKRSWYMFFFQHRLADTVVAANDLAFIDELWRDWSPGYDATADLALLKPSLRDPANLAAALGYYRASFGTGPRNDRFDALELAARQAPPQPTLVLHGATDGCIGAEVAEKARKAAASITFESIPGAGHFLHLEKPGVVNARIVEFLTR